MIIKEITIRNFRSYYNINPVEFNDGLTILVGDNGDGKTTFFEALEWLFDTTEQNPNPLLISEKRISELNEQESDIISVSMVFDHDGEKIIEKSFLFKKENKALKTYDLQFRGFNNQGSEREPIDGKYLLDLCFEAAIRKYCLFKGEDNLYVFNHPEALNYLIETFSNIKQFEPFYTGEENNHGFTDYAEYHSRKVLEKDLRSDKKTEKNEREIRTQLEDKRQKLSHLNQRLKSERKNATTYTDKLELIENSKAASESLIRINDRLKSLKEQKAKIENSIKEEYSIMLLDDMWILCGFESIFNEFQQKVSKYSKEKRKLEREDYKLKGKEELVKEIANGIIPLSPNVPDKVSMQEMIDDEFCKVCGREAEKDSDAYNFMVKKLNDLVKSQKPKEEKKEKPLFPNNFIKELEQLNSNLDYNQSDINKLESIITENIEFNQARRADLNEVQKNIDIEEENKKKLLAQSNGLSEEQLSNNFENINSWWDYKNRAEKEIVILERDLANVENEIENLQKSYSELAEKSLAATSSKIYDALNKIKHAFKTAKEKNTNEFLADLESKANEYLKKLNIGGFYGIIRLIKTPDGTARVMLMDKSDTTISSPNQALKTTMYMSILFAVSDLTALNRENDYPLIFDAPTSSFSPQKESDFFKIISHIKKQCIIFTKSFLKENGELGNSKIEPLKCAIYRLEKEKPFNDLDLSTIKTNVTYIKR